MKDYTSLYSRALLLVKIHKETKYLRKDSWKKYKAMGGSADTDSILITLASLLKESK